MAGQQQEHVKQRREDEPDVPDSGAPLPGGGGSAAAQAREVDDLLDEIDSVLETNAETFVQGFVQKGGQ